MTSTALPTVGVLGTGSYLPDRVVDNAEIERRVPRAEAHWITERTRIEGRRYAAEHEATSDLAAAAGRQALARAGLGPADLDYIIVATSTGDSPQPPTSCLVQHQLGATSAACFDINVVCAGFVYGAALARSLIAVRPQARVLVVGADVYSRILDYDDRSTAVLLGDGAGAAVFGAVEAPYGIVEVGLASRGDAQDLIRVEAGGSRKPTTAETVAQGGHYFRMNGRGVRDFVMETVPPAVHDLLLRAGLKLGDVDHFVPHQANGVLLRQLVEKVGLQHARTHYTLERYGNVGSASVPIALDDAYSSGALADGDVVVLAGFGGGMSLGTCVLRWCAR
ncbi:3-oxoacyl-ACP synthase III family protein [Goodfellowiella coeruleoviolacea]|uniref:3-oxoacyl-[acyl-carrier-protein] synthase-3 n=1 Tax=Goodfellowiella coeruleoviolacea TaxID=334858 RepID=A0AAE3KHJ9_9PSEU|nr:ketoacyl-ACP synthase III [Goodfellowiella coeruleoviolacea]MCP2167420.1 3-oxoacyl-[acyl-carrier-protein] synthase-3 [Goodfellowiella coeruleoviolacea]